jgi:hypothetical protein
MQRLRIPFKQLRSTGIASYSQTSIVCAKRSKSDSKTGRRDHIIPSDPKKKVKGVVDSSLRVDRRAHRLRGYVNKHLSNDLKSRAHTTRHMEAMVESLHEECGFTLKQITGHSTVTMHKQYSYAYTDDNGSKKIGLENITVEFDAYDEDSPNEETQTIFLLDVIVENESKTKGKGKGKVEGEDMGVGVDGEKEGDGLSSSRIVFTCTPDRPLGSQVLSVRYVPLGASHLDQSLYDGPTMDVMSANWNNGKGIRVNERANANSDGEDVIDIESGEFNGMSFKDLQKLQDSLEKRAVEAEAEQSSGSNNAKEGDEDEDEEEDNDDEEEEDASVGRNLIAISDGIHNYLDERGVDARVLAMCKAYAAYKYRQERQEGLRFLIDFLEPTPAK